MSSSSFNSWGDLKKYCGDYIQQASTTVSSKGSNGSSSNTGYSGRARNINKTKARQVANKLKSEIRAACSAPPWNIKNIFDTLKVDSDENGRISVSMPFTNRAYLPSKFEKDRHYSFIPVLMDMGWTTKFASKNSITNGLTRPTFGHFEGTHAIKSIINSFNRTYAPHGYHAEFVYDESQLGWIPGQYIKGL